MLPEAAAPAPVATLPSAPPVFDQAAPAAPPPAGASAQPPEPTAAAPAAPAAPATATPPAAEAAPATPPEVAPIAPEVQQYMAELQARDDERAIQDTVARLTTQFETEQGLTPEQAKWAAQREVGRAVQHFRANQAQQQRINDAVEIGQRYGVDPRQLLGHPNPQAMIQAAMLATTFTKVQSEMARLKAENEALKRGAVPAQTFAAPGVAATPAPGDYVQKLKSGGPLPTAAEIDRYTQRYLTGAAG